MQQVVCDDYCFSDNCRACNDKRLDMIQPILVEEIVHWIQLRRLNIKPLVEDGVMDKGVLDNLNELLTAFGHPPRKGE